MSFVGGLDTSTLATAGTSTCLNLAPTSIGTSGGPTTPRSSRSDECGTCRYIAEAALRWLKVHSRDWWVGQKPAGDVLWTNNLKSTLNIHRAVLNRAHLLLLKPLLVYKVIICVKGLQVTVSVERIYIIFCPQVGQIEHVVLQRTFFSFIGFVDLFSLLNPLFYYLYIYTHTCYLKLNRIVSSLGAFPSNLTTINFNKKPNHPFIKLLKQYKCCWQKSKGECCSPTSSIKL